MSYKNTFEKFITLFLYFTKKYHISLEAKNFIIENFLTTMLICPTPLA